MAEHRRGLHRQGARASARNAAGGRGRGRGDTRGAGDRDAQDLQGADQHRGEPAFATGAVYVDEDTLQVPPRHGSGRTLAGKRLGAGHRARVGGDGLHEHAVPRLRPRRNGDHRGRRAFAGACGLPGAVAHAAFSHLQSGAGRGGARGARGGAAHLLRPAGQRGQKRIRARGRGGGRGGGGAV